jgi:hypothetical protein
MGKILSVVLGLSVLAFLGYRAMYQSAKNAPPPTVPTEKLENVRKAAKDIETKQLEAADRALEKATPE